MGSKPVLDPSMPADETVLPHHFRVTGSYSTAKNLIRAQMATPAVSAADST